MLSNRYGTTAESLLDSIADGMASHGLAAYFGRNIKWVWVIGYWHSELLSASAGPAPICNSTCTSARGGLPGN